ncbi:creatininase family protein [Cyanobium sp. CH-040]|uniref:creatininase family protein n=1 Tax=Cyanobium sp. CH-040 TaxID=2823708 RepID=UPI0020CCFA2C|nr:creatininase family protein [Cyanobium sp. CH-040]MCP9928158.1 creatininase family protein [Cyanobium sp. CH-040]
MPPQRRLDQLAWPQVRQAARRRGSTVVWPWGSIEQHGPHLPLATDALFAERILDAALADLDAALPVWRLPLQAIGFSPEHQGFAGTLSLPPELLIQTVCSVGAQLAACGFERLVLFNAHGGQIALLQTAARELRVRHPGLGVLPCFLWSGIEGIAERLPEAEREGGLHAGLAETSLMLHLEPALVGVERPRDGALTPPPPPGWSLEGAAPSAWLMGDLSASGVVGDARGADPELGATFCAALVQGWRRRFESLLGSDWPPGRVQAGAPAAEDG